MRCFSNRNRCQEPFIRKDDLSKGFFVSAVGSYNELTEDTITKFGKIVVDNLEQVKHRGNLAAMFNSGKLIEDNIYSEVGYIVARIKPGREHQEETILFVPIGMGSIDVALADNVYNKALQREIGNICITSTRNEFDRYQTRKRIIKGVSMRYGKK